MKIAYAKPGTSRENKTGSWRSMRPIPTDKCIACGTCVRFCPERCITFIERTDGSGKKMVAMDYDYCKGCGICANECPVKAISMMDEEEAKGCSPNKPVL